jgi:hypothetical protein
MKNLFFILFVMLFVTGVTLSQMTPCSLTPLPGQNLTLDWPDYPGALSYRLQISTDEIFIYLIVDVTGLNQSQYTITSGLPYYTCYYWRWRAILEVGNGPWSQVCRFCVAGPTGIKNISNEIPHEYNLYQNYPNPFNPETKISFDIAGRETQKTSLIIYDILGNEISAPVNENLLPGSYEVIWNASDYPSGVYIYKLSAESFVDSKKMVVIK